MKCPRCNNTDISYFYLGSKGYYCRKCIGFRRILIEEELIPLQYSISDKADHFRLGYHLTEKQNTAAAACKKAIIDTDVVLHCVCGAGKTEITIASIADCLKRQLKVGYAVARREVVLELSGRFRKIFPSAAVVTVCAGHNDPLTGDLIVCTTHQLYRYPKTFDLLILDEVDAFPFKGNEVLSNIALNACKGHIIYSTATIDETTKKLISQRPYVTVSLWERPHHKPLIVPKIIWLPYLFGIIWLIAHLNNNRGQYIIFTETKRECLMIYRLIRIFFKTTYVYSDLNERNENITAFRKRRFKVIVATSVLERGITIKGVNVILMFKNGRIFDRSSIIQMVGRVGRSMQKTDGQAYIVTSFINKAMIEAIMEIRYANKMSLL